MLRAREFDEFFPGTEMEATVRRQVREMSIDPDAGGRIRYHLEPADGCSR